jgi:hypothetical protein
VPVPTPGFELPEGEVVEELEEPEEQPANRVEAPVAPRATTPPVAMPRDKKVRRLNPLPRVTELPHRFNPAHYRRI